jgi:DNA (cytosine-5)-methyltransferase 3A
MYDGISVGRYCLEKLGYKNVKYYSFEIDKYAMEVSQNNYPDIIQCGDAFQIRDNDFNICKMLDKIE